MYQTVSVAEISLSNTCLKSCTDCYFKAGWVNIWQAISSGNENNFAYRNTLIEKRFLENTSSVWNHIDAALPLVRKASVNLFCSEFWLLSRSFTLQERQAAMLCCQRRQVSRGISSSGQAAVPRRPQAVFSMSTAMPCPPPMHADPTAYFPPRRLRRNRNRGIGYCTYCSWSPLIKSAAPVLILWEETSYQLGVIENDVLECPCCYFSSKIPLSLRELLKYFSAMTLDIIWFQPLSQAQTSSTRPHLKISGVVFKLSAEVVFKCYSLLQTHSKKQISARCKWSEVSWLSTKTVLQVQAKRHSDLHPEGGIKMVLSILSKPKEPEFLKMG